MDDQQLDDLVGANAIASLTEDQADDYRRAMRRYFESPFVLGRADRHPDGFAWADEAAVARGAYEHLRTAPRISNSRHIIDLAARRRIADEDLEAAKDEHFAGGLEVEEIAEVTRSTASAVERRVEGKPHSNAIADRNAAITALYGAWIKSRDAKLALYATVRGALAAGRPLKRLHAETGLALGTLRKLRNELGLAANDLVGAS